jgi:hypothetical protein
MNKPVFGTFINDALLSDNVHSVFHLPPNDRNLNLTGLMWAPVDMCITRKNICFCLDIAMKLAEEKFHRITKGEQSLKCSSALDGEQNYLSRLFLVIDHLHSSQHFFLYGSHFT